MTDYKNNEIQKSRDYTVVKSNSLVLNTRYNYTVNQQKMIAFICSKIKPTSHSSEQYQLKYDFEILDYINIMGLQKTGDIYREVKSTLKSLRDKSYWLKLPNGSETTVSWIAKATTNEKSGLAKYTIDEDLAPYLFDLKNKYLSYGLSTILNFTSKYSIRLYEILKAYHDMKCRVLGSKCYDNKVIEYEINVSELKSMLYIEDKYNNFKDLRHKVIEIAQREINKLSDISFSYDTMKKGKKIVKITFHIVFKQIFERIISEENNNKLFNQNS